jgi:hypothetical protein
VIKTKIQESSKKINTKILVTNRKPFEKLFKSKTTSGDSQP